MWDVSADNSAQGGNGPSIAETGEFGLIRQITGHGATTASGEPVVVPEVLQGPGDDCAVLQFSGPVVSTTDALVEGVHFRRDWSSATEVGRKAAAVNLADVEAMGARPIALLVAFAAPSDLPLKWATDCSDGLRTEAAEAGAVVVGGDVTRSAEVMISVTALGELAGPPVLRSGAQPGQVIAIRGLLGWAAAGLVVLSRGFRSPRAVVEAQKVPRVPYGAGVQAAAAGAGAMIDVSDGLLADLGHIARASQVVCNVDSEALPVPESLQAVSSATGISPQRLLLTGGEDHSLVATFDPGRVPAEWQVIGTVGERTSEPGVRVDGAVWEGAQGYQHFRQ